MNAPVGMVLNILHYEIFENDLQEAYRELEEDETG